MFMSTTGIPGRLSRCVDATSVPPSTATAGIMWYPPIFLGNPFEKPPIPE